MPPPPGASQLPQDDSSCESPAFAPALFRNLSAIAANAPASAAHGGKQVGFRPIVRKMSENEMEVAGAMPTLSVSHAGSLLVGVTHYTAHNDSVLL